VCGNGAGLFSTAVGLYLDWCYELVALSRNSLDEIRIVGGIVERFAQSFDSRIEAGVKINKRIALPKCGAQFFPANQFAGTLKQFEENPAWLILELKPHPVLAQFCGPQIELKRLKAIA